MDNEPFGKNLIKPIEKQDNKMKKKFERNGSNEHKYEKILINFL